MVVNREIACHVIDKRTGVIISSGGVTKRFNAAFCVDIIIAVECLEVSFLIDNALSRILN